MSFLPQKRNSNLEEEGGGERGYYCPLNSNFLQNIYPVEVGVRYFLLIEIYLIIFGSLSLSDVLLDYTKKKN